MSRNVRAKVKFMKGREHTNAHDNQKACQESPKVHNRATSASVRAYEVVRVRAFGADEIG